MFKSKTTWLGIVLLILFDQGIKLYISSNFAAEQPVPIFPPVLYLFPTLNTNYTWISSMMDLSLSKWIYVALVAILLILIILFYRYLQNRLPKNNTVNVLFAFVFSGAVCSLVDKIFWNGSLDFIQLSHLFTFDTKDVYVSIFIGLVLLFLVQNNKIIKQIGSRDVLRGFADQFKSK
ncbi:MAG: signal peptidase II [Eubacteriales bacterium]